MGEIWMPTQIGEALPAFTVKGGHDIDGNAIYLARCEHDGEWLPANVLPHKGYALITSDEKEYKKQNVELLIGPGYIWVPSDNDHCIRCQITTGFSKDGQPIYIGRGQHNGSLLVGKICANHGCLEIPYDGQELQLNDFEVLIYDTCDEWKPANLKSLPKDAVVVGNDRDGKRIVVARATHNGFMLPAMLFPDSEEACMVHEHAKISANDVEVLVGDHYSWIKPLDNEIPLNAVFADRGENGEPLFVGRAEHNGSMTMGQVSLETNCLIVSSEGKTVNIDDYELLVRQCCEEV